MLEEGDDALVGVALVDHDLARLALLGGGHVGDLLAGSGRAHLIGGQAGLVSPILFVLFGAATVRGLRRDASEAAYVLEIAESAATLRYWRALKRFKELWQKLYPDESRP